MRDAGDRGRKGFTLIELLVVIAIIAVLAAILFPVFLRAKAQARTTECVSRLKDMGLAYSMYTDSWNSTMPSGVNGPQNGLIRWPIIQQLMPYVRAPRTHIGYVEADPDARKQDTGIPEVFFCPSFNEEWRKTHGWYMNAGTYVLVACDAIATNEYPAKTVGDCISMWNDWVSQGRTNTRVSPPSRGASGAQLSYCIFGGQFRGTPSLWYPHNNGSNVLYFDGHVKYHEGVQGGS
jgi:prepilin-type N-terminal cleavage/methylation domain-containing protein/prepilin-type processing-associated H-X9-DG protein